MVRPDLCPPDYTGAVTVQVTKQLNENKILTFNSPRDYFVRSACARLNGAGAGSGQRRDAASPLRQDGKCAAGIPIGRRSFDKSLRATPPCT
jgi:hypothetical protein